MPGRSLDKGAERIVAGVKLASTNSRQFDGASQEPCSRYGPCDWKRIGCAREHRATEVGVATGDSATPWTRVDFLSCPVAESASSLVEVASRTTSASVSVTLSMSDLFDCFWPILRADQWRTAASTEGGNHCDHRPAEAAVD
jgi:hypothetical protein